MKKWDIWLAKVYYDSSSEFKYRPVLVLDPKELVVLSFKLTTHIPGSKFPGEYQIAQWKSAGLLKPSVIRGSQVLELENKDFIRKIGKLQDSDIENFKVLISKEVPRYSYLLERFIPDDESGDFGLRGYQF